MERITKKHISDNTVIIIIESEKKLPEKFYKSLHKLVGLHSKVAEYKSLNMFNLLFLTEYLIQHEIVVFARYIALKIHRLMSFNLIRYTHNHSLRGMLWSLLNYLM